MLLSLTAFPALCECDFVVAGHAWEAAEQRVQVSLLWWVGMTLKQRGRRQSAEWVLVPWIENKLYTLPCFVWQHVGWLVGLGKFLLSRQRKVETEANQGTCLLSVCKTHWCQWQWCIPGCHVKSCIDFFHLAEPWVVPPLSTWVQTPLSQAL